MIKKGTKKYVFGFVMSTALGNQTRYLNFHKFADMDQEVECIWAPVSHFILSGQFDPFKYLSGGLRARAIVLYQSRQVLYSLDKFDALLIHMFEVDILLALRSYIFAKPLRIISTDDAPAIDPSTYPFHPLDADKSPWRKAFRLKIDLWRSRRANLLIPFSNWAANLHRLGTKKDKNQIIPIHVGIDLSLWPDRKRSLYPSKQHTKILFVGGDFIRKGGELLLESFQQHFADFAELHLVTKQAPKILPKNTFVYTDFEANDSRLAELYRNADIFVLPTTSDLSSWVVLEAMASGCPVIVTAIGGIVDLVEPGITGLFIEPGNHKSLQSAIQSLIDDPEKCQIMGMAARQSVEQNFDASKNVPKILSAMKTLVDNARIAGV